MYVLRGFKVVVLSGDHEFTALSELAGNLPSAPRLNWVAASQHCGLIEQNIHFLKEKIHSLRHSLPFERVMVVHMVLHIIKFGAVCQITSPHHLCIFICHYQKL